MEKGDVLDLYVERLAPAGGKGVCRSEEGRVVFVPYVAPQEKIRVEITKVKKRYAEGELREVLEPSLFRVQPPCPVFGKCGGCQWQMISYEEQLRQKKNFLEHQLHKLEYLEEIAVEPSPQEFNYRNRIQVHQKDHKIGFFQKKTHSLVEIDQCMIAEEEINQKLKELSQEKRRARIELAKNREGGLEVFLGKRSAEASLFSQVNTNQNLNMIQQILETLKEDPAEVIFDLYCGDGNITFPVGESFKLAHITGVELSQASIKKAQSKNSEIQFIASDVKEFLKNNFLKPDVVILDPPRAGLDQAVVSELVKLSPPKIIYVSCDLGTLSRDLELLSSQYKINFVKGFDMFPQTHHLETMVSLKLKEVE